ncbi:MAG: hypothetical protein DHS20C02_07510 [Micavibrio sp.]|nr:MAG: hypothetical protein DHS20C02_07510 [Micavibrio sp.]
MLDNTNTQNKDVLYNTTTQKVFNQAQKSVYQIRVINKKSGQKSSIGSGFRVHPHGFFVTNYHVISEVVLEPDDYSLEYLGHANNRAVLKIRNIDVVNDLAVLEPVEKEDGLSKRYLNISGKAMDQGAPIFSIGNPHDLGMTIINGVYNGLLEKSFYKKILFSGALNPGMSGGPALNVDGKVIGVNVATSGDDLGYLVPAKFVRALLDGEPPEVEWKNVVRDQLLNNSKKVILGLLSKPWETKNFGEFQIPENLDAAFKCWGAGHSESEEKNYSYAQMVCSTQDNLYISSSIDTGKIRFSALKIDSVAMNRFAFSQFYKSNYESVSGNVSDKSIEDVKEFSCQNTFALIAKKKWKVAICARPYKKFSGLYDIFVKAALMGRGQEGYVLDIFMDGFAESSGQDFAEKFLETMQ